MPSLPPLPLANSLPGMLPSQVHSQHAPSGKGQLFTISYIEYACLEDSVPLITRALQPAQRACTARSSRKMQRCIA